MQRRAVIGVMGAGETARPQDLLLAEELGVAIARRGWVLLTGGRPVGVMQAASQGAAAVEGHLVVGVLPGEHAREAAAGLDLALVTGLGQARNVINVLSSQVVVICGAGGPGTLSEAAHALRAGRPLVLLAVPEPWRLLLAELGGNAAAAVNGLSSPVCACATVAEAIGAIERLLEAQTRSAPPAATRQRTSGAAALPQAAFPLATLPVALVQLRAGEDAASNRRHAEAWLERALVPRAGRPQPRLLMLPEIWNAPYAAGRFVDYAEPIPEPGALLEGGPSPSLAMLAAVARRHGVSLIGGSIPERGTDGRLYNTATVIDPHGRLLAKHRKLHLFDVDVPGGIRFFESDSLSPGQALTVLPGDGDPLATGLAAPPDLGLLICYDIRFPELALLLQQRHGCSLLACPAAFNTTTGPRHWHLLMRARAVDTQCFLLACSSARPPGDGYPSYGHSLVVDPWGTVIAEAGIDEQVLHAELDLSQVALARQAIPTGQQRRHDLYRLEPAAAGDEEAAEQRPLRPIPLTKLEP